MLPPKYFHRDLEIFLEVAKHLNISKTAEALGVGQSGVSKAISRLEFHSRGSLFVRTSKGVELTMAGERLKGSLERAISALKAPNSVDQMLYKFSGHRTVLSFYLPKILSVLNQRRNFEWEVSFATSPQTVRLVSSLDVDFGIVMGQVRPPELICRPLGIQYLGLWGATPDTNNGPIAYNPEMLDSGKILRRFSNRKLIAIPDYEVIYQCVASGDVQGILPNTLIRDQRIQMVGTKLREATINLIYHSQNSKESSFRQLAQSLAIPIETTC